MRLPLHLLIAVLALALAACGGEDEAESTAETPAATATATPTPAPDDAETVAGVQIANAEDIEQEPIVTIPEGAEPPDELVSRDLVEGSGDRVGETDNVTVRYTGVSWSTGEKFDASWDRGMEPISFPLGQQSVIPGWDEGVPGMRVGGRRLLIIPPDMGYGASGQPPAIGPDETLVFVVDAVAAG